VTHLAAVFVVELSQLGKTVYVRRSRMATLLTGDHVVGFQWPNLVALVDGLGPFVDGNTAWNMVFACLRLWPKRDFGVSNE